MKKLLMFILSIFMIPLVSAVPVFGTTPGNLYIFYPTVWTLLVIALFYTLIVMLGKFSEAELNIYDIAMYYSVFFAFLFTHYFITAYFDDAFMIGIGEVFIKVFGSTHLIVSLIFLGLNLIKRNKAP